MQNSIRKLEACLDNKGLSQNWGQEVFVRNIISYFLKTAKILQELLLLICLGKILKQFFY